MAPRRLILRRQQEILLDYLEQNRDVAIGTIQGSISRNILASNRKKWVEVTRMLNVVPDGIMKTPVGWNKYWNEFKYVCKKKALNAKKNNGTKNYAPLNNLEIRALEISGLSTMLDDALCENNISVPFGRFDDSDSELTKPNLDRNDESSSEHVNKKIHIDIKSIKRSQPTLEINGMATDNERNTISPPPRWALDLEERRIAAEERMACALESIASVVRMQEMRRNIFDEKITDALTSIAGSIEALNSNVQEIVQNFKQNSNQNNDTTF